MIATVEEIAVNQKLKQSLSWVYGWRFIVISFATMFLLNIANGFFDLDISSSNSILISCLFGAFLSFYWIVLYRKGPRWRIAIVKVEDQDPRFCEESSHEKT